MAGAGTARGLPAEVVVGIDPGLAATGYAVVRLDGAGRPPAVLEAGLVRTPARAALERRLEHLYAALLDLFRLHRPACVVVEDLYASYAHPRTAILMGHARGAVFLAAAHAGSAVRSFTASRVKKALTGRGDASKRQVLRMVQAVLGLPTLPPSDHVGDALALAVCYQVHRSRRPLGGEGA